MLGSSRAVRRLPLLDHEFTIFGRVDGGQAAAEQLLEGDRIARVEVVE